MNLNENDDDFDDFLETCVTAPSAHSETRISKESCPKSPSVIMQEDDDGNPKMNEAKSDCEMSEEEEDDGDINEVFNLGGDEGNNVVAGGHKETGQGAVVVANRKDAPALKKVTILQIENVDFPLGFESVQKLFEKVDFSNVKDVVLPNFKSWITALAEVVATITNIEVLDSCYNCITTEKKKRRKALKIVSSVLKDILEKSNKKIDSDDDDDDDTDTDESEGPNALKFSEEFIGNFCCYKLNTTNSQANLPYCVSSGLNSFFVIKLYVRRSDVYPAVKGCRSFSAVLKTLDSPNHIPNVVKKFKAFKRSPYVVAKDWSKLENTVFDLSLSFAQMFKRSFRDTTIFDWLVLGDQGLVRLFSGCSTAPVKKQVAKSVTEASSSKQSKIKLTIKNKSDALETKSMGKPGNDDDGSDVEAGTSCYPSQSEEIIDKIGTPMSFKKWKNANTPAASSSTTITGPFENWKGESFTLSPSTLRQLADNNVSYRGNKFVACLHEEICKCSNITELEDFVDDLPLLDIAVDIHYRTYRLGEDHGFERRLRRELQGVRLLQRNTLVAANLPPVVVEGFDDGPAKWRNLFKQMINLRENDDSNIKLLGNLICLCFYRLHKRMYGRRRIMNSLEKLKGIPCSVLVNASKIFSTEAPKAADVAQTCVLLGSNKDEKKSHEMATWSRENLVNSLTAQFIYSANTDTLAFYPLKDKFDPMKRLEDDVSLVFTAVLIHNFTTSDEKTNLVGLGIELMGDIYKFFEYKRFLFDLAKRKDGQSNTLPKGGGDECIENFAKIVKELIRLDEDKNSLIQAFGVVFRNYLRGLQEWIYLRCINEEGVKFLDECHKPDIGFEVELPHMGNLTIYSKPAKEDAVQVIDLDNDEPNNDDLEREKHANLPTPTHKSTTTPTTKTTTTTVESSSSSSSLRHEGGLSMRKRTKSGTITLHLDNHNSKTFTSSKIVGETSSESNKSTTTKGNRSETFLETLQQAVTSPVDESVVVDLENSETFLQSTINKPGHVGVKRKSDVSEKKDEKVKDSSTPSKKQRHNNDSENHTSGSAKTHKTSGNATVTQAAAAATTTTTGVVDAKLKSGNSAGRPRTVSNNNNNNNNRNNKNNVDDNLADANHDELREESSNKKHNQKIKTIISSGKQTEATPSNRTNTKSTGTAAKTGRYDVRMDSGIWFGMSALGNANADDRFIKGITALNEMEKYVSPTAFEELNESLVANFMQRSTDPRFVNGGSDHMHQVLMQCISRKSPESNIMGAILKNESKPKTTDDDDDHYPPPQPRRKRHHSEDKSAN